VDALWRYSLLDFLVIGVHYRRALFSGFCDLWMVEKEVRGLEGGLQNSRAHYLFVGCFQDPCHLSRPAGNLEWVELPVEVRH
jgi:hypothetical protein